MSATVYGPAHPLTPGARYSIEETEHQGCEDCSRLAHQAGEALDAPDGRRHPANGAASFDAATREHHYALVRRETAPPWTPASSTHAAALRPGEPLTAPHTFTRAAELRSNISTERERLSAYAHIRDNPGTTEPTRQWATEHANTTREQITTMRTELVQLLRAAPGPVDPTDPRAPEHREDD